MKPVSEATKFLKLEEVEEPCLNHDKINCPTCEREMKHTLKRSISHNAVNNLRRVESSTSLYRTLSQSSCFSTTSVNSARILNDSYAEFLLDIMPPDEEMKRCWEQLPKQTKQMYIARALKRSEAKGVTDHLKDPDLGKILGDGKPPINNSFFHYRDKIIQNLNKDGNLKNYDAIQMTKIASKKYNKLSRPALEQEQIETHRDIDEFNRRRRKSLYKYILENEFQDDLDPFLQEINISKEQNMEVIARLYNELKIFNEHVATSPVVSPIVNKNEKIEKVVSPPSPKASKPPNQSKQKKQIKNESILPSFYTKLMGKFKRKKKQIPASLDLYRIPTRTS